MNTRSREASNRFAERRRREDEAPRLKAEIPSLRSLRLDVEEHHGSSAISGTKHVRHIMVDHAPALFLIACADSGCRDGGHDLTHGMLRHLRAGETEFVLEDVCNGGIGSAVCNRIVRLVATAVFDSPKQ